MTNTCQLCKYNDDGTCKRLPPQALMERIGSDSYSQDIMGPCSHQPYVSADDWCGEFAAQPADVEDAIDMYNSLAGQTRELFKPGTAVWKPCVSSGYDGFVCETCRTWVYANQARNCRCNAMVILENDLAPAPLMESLEKIKYQCNECADIISTNDVFLSKICDKDGCFGYYEEVEDVQN